MEERRDAVGGTMTLGELVDGPWQACLARCRPSTQVRVESILRTQLLPAFAALPLRDIDHRAVDAWFHAYSRTAPAGANRALDVLRQIFGFAADIGAVTANPTRYTRRNPARISTRFLSRAELARLHAALDAHRPRGVSGRQQVDIIRLLLLTGCRKSEIVRLRWSEVVEGRLMLRDSKTGPRMVWLSDDARALVEAQPRWGAYVFPLSRQRADEPRSDELSVWKAVRVAAGIAGVRLHDLRHTFASHAAISGVPLPVVSRLLGHADIKMTMRYTHVAEREIEAAAERIGSAIGGILDGQLRV